MSVFSVLGKVLVCVVQYGGSMILAQKYIYVLVLMCHKLFNVSALGMVTCLNRHMA
jgi:hypothetical protein